MTSGQLVQVLFAIAAVVSLSQLLGAAARRVGQPAVMAEIVVGVLVGPTVLDGVLAETLFPAGVRPMLDALANVGLVLFIFYLSTGFARERPRGRAVVAVSAASMLVPFALGTALAVLVAPAHSGVGAVLFLGTAMSATAFPVLARIIQDTGRQNSRVARLALASAGLGDAMTWTVLAVLAVLFGGHGQMMWRLAVVVPFTLALFVVVRPLLRRMGDRTPSALVYAGLFASAAVTEWAGLHMIFGAFLFGLVIPVSDKNDLLTGVNRVGTLLFLPIYFVLAGARVDLSSLDIYGIGELVLILVVAVVGKTGAVYVAGRTVRLSRHDAAGLAVLMNTRGLTEIIILTTGLQLGLIDQRLYSLMVVMAILTTLMTAPLMSWLDHRRAATDSSPVGARPDPTSGTGPGPTSP